MFARDLTLFPNVWTWENYANVWFNPPFPTYFWNSFYIAAITTALSVSVSIYASYAIAPIPFRGRFAFGILLLLTQMFPHIMLVLPAVHDHPRPGAVQHSRGADHRLHRVLAAVFGRDAAQLLRGDPLGTGGCG